MRGIRYDPERRKGSALLRRTDLFATLARLAAACLAVAFALLLVPEKAYAVTSGEVIYGPSVANGPLDNTSYYVQVYAFDRYTAALGALGYNPQDSRFTSDVKAYLSNSSTGGAFYDFAQQFTNSPYENDGSSVIGGTVGVDVENFSMYFAYRQNVDLYGSNVWWANYTTTQSLAARTSIGLVLAGSIAGGTGGGSQVTGGLVPESIVLDNPRGLKYSGNYWYSYEPVSVSGTQTVNFTSRQELSNRLAGLGCSYICVVFAPWEKHMNTSSYTPTLYLFASSDPISIEYTDYDSVAAAGNNIPKSFDVTVTSEGNLYRYIANSGDSGMLNLKVSNSGVMSGYKDIGDVTLVAVNDTTYTIPHKDPSNSQRYVTYCNSNVSNAPVVPPTNWPTDPTPNPPTQPTVPNPPTGGTPNPPTNPNPPSDPIYGTQPIYVTNTFTADFQGLLDALDEHCKHLQNALFFNFSGFYLLLTTKLTNDFATLRSLITAEFVWLGGTIEQSASDMMLYLKDLFEWLAEQFDFSVSGSGYDDDTVVSWLKKIYGKLGGGVNTRPTDPVSDPFDIGQWLKTLFGNLFTALDDLAGGLLSQLASWVGGLAGKFPFSIPWDVAAILGLLVAEPVAPNFDVPWYTLNGSGTLTQAGLIEVDLADWSQYLEGVRFMIKVCFVMFLAMHTKDFMELMEKAVGLDA